MVTGMSNAAGMVGILLQICFLLALAFYLGYTKGSSTYVCKKCGEKKAVKR